MAQLKMVWATTMPGYTSKKTHKVSKCFDQYGYSNSRGKKKKKLCWLATDELAHLLDVSFLFREQVLNNVGVGDVLVL